MELTDLQRLAVADAMGKAIKTMTNPRGGAHGAPTLRTEADDALRRDYEEDGTDRRRISIGGVDVGTLSARVSKPERGTRVVVEDKVALMDWLGEDGSDVFDEVTRTDEFTDLVLKVAQGLGVLPDGCRVEDYERPARWLGTTLRVDPAKVGQALGPWLPEAVAGLLVVKADPRHTIGGGE